MALVMVLLAPIGLPDSFQAISRRPMRSSCGWSSSFDLGCVSLKTVCRLEALRIAYRLRPAHQQAFRQGPKTGSSGTPAVRQYGAAKQRPQHPRLQKQVIRRWRQIEMTVGSQ